MNPAPAGTHPPAASRLRPGTLAVLALLFVLVVAALIGYPYYKTYVAPWHETVLKVGDRVFDMRDYIRTHRLFAGAGQPGSASFEVSMRVLETLQSRELIRLEAEKRKIRVSDEDVDREIRSRILGERSDPKDFDKLYEGFLRNARLSDRQYRKWVRTDLLERKLRDQLGREIRTRADQVHVFAIRVAKPEKAEEIRRRILAGGEFEKWARRETMDFRFKSKGGDMGWIPRGVDDTKVIDQVRALGIFTKTLEAAEEARSRLEAGEDFASVAKALSEHKESRKKGGELGWLPRELRPIPFSDESVFEMKPGSLSEPLATRDGFWVVKVLEKAPKGKLIDDIAFSLPVGKLSPPLFTEAGYYLIKVAEKAKQRPLAKKHLETLRAKALDRWLKQTAKKGSEEGWIEWNWDSFKYAWANEQLRQ